MEWLARAVGAFYVFAGLMALQAWQASRLLDNVLEALEGFNSLEGHEAPLPDARNERISTRWLAAGAVLTLLSAAALLALSWLAAPLFVVNALVQGGYLLWAGRALPPTNAMESQGRRRTINAFVIYLAATLCVLWFLARGILR